MLGLESRPSIQVADFDLSCDGEAAIALPSLSPRDVGGDDVGNSGMELWLLEASGRGPLVERLCFRSDGYFEGVEVLRILFNGARFGCDLFLLLAF